MGAYGATRERGSSNAEWFAQEILGPDRTILAHHTARTSGEWQAVFYAAVRDPDGKTWALVVPHAWRRSRWDDCNFYYKPLDEGMGPCESEAPAKVLDVLTPTDSERENEWRQRCRDNLATRAARPKVKRGDTVVFARAIRFTDGAEHDRFEFLERNTFRVDYTRYRISGWRDRYTYTVEASRFPGAPTKEETNA